MHLRKPRDGRPAGISAAQIDLAYIAICCHYSYHVDMPTQTSMNISLPSSLRDWVEDRVANEGYGTASEYIRDLVREDRKRKAIEIIDKKLMEAINSGEMIEMTPETWRQIRATVKERIANRAKARK